MHAALPRVTGVSGDAARDAVLLTNTEAGVLAMAFDRARVVCSITYCGAARSARRGQLESRPPARRSRGRAR